MLLGKSAFIVSAKGWERLALCFWVVFCEWIIFYLCRIRFEMSDSREDSDCHFGMFYFSCRT